MPKISRTQCELHYEIFGENGPWITLVNGHTRSHKDFRNMVKILTKKNFRCLTLDNRGSGETNVTAPFTFDDMVLDVVSLWDELNIDKTHLLGISMGGMICQRLAAEASHVIRSLTLISTTASSEWISGIGDESWGDSLDTVMSKLSHYFASSFLQKNKLLVQAMAKNILKNIQEGNFAEGAKFQRLAIENIDVSANARMIKCPTYIIHGLEDEIIEPRAASELDDLIDNTTLDLLDGMGHLLLAEYNKKLYDNVLNFIQSTQSN